MHEADDLSGMPVGPQFKGVALFADPVHRYIQFTVPIKGGETTEKDLVDSPWLQRLRAIYQLQSARWVYPSAEHSRFQHALGAMHVGGRFARHLYPSLAKVVKDCPSAAYIEELIRLTALLHDVGHGPMGHFFDDNYLDRHGVTHEDLGQKIITRKLASIIKGIRRSPSGEFRGEKRLNPAHIAYLLKKGGEPPHGIPSYLHYLKPLFNGIYTVDNLDYVLRDSYMCGVAVGPVDMDRLLHYSFYTEKGLTLDSTGTEALIMFLNARMYMYSNVYYHRTTRAIDIHLREIFRDTMDIMLGKKNPLDDLDRFLSLTDWSLLEGVKGWKNSRSKRKAELASEWEMILNRRVKWKMAYSKNVPRKEFQELETQISEKALEGKIAGELKGKLKGDYPFKVDMAYQDPRPLNPTQMEERQIYIHDTSSGRISDHYLKELFKFVPARVVHCRIYTRDHHHDHLISAAAERVLKDHEDAIKTSV